MMLKENIRNIRKEKGMTQEALAKERGDEAAAEACAEAAIALVEKKEENTAIDFLTDNHKKLLVSSNLNTPDLIRQLLTQSATENAFVLTSTRTK